MMYTNDEMRKGHLLGAIFATSSANELELLLIKGGVDKNMTRDFIEFIKEKNNDTSYLNDLVTVHPIEEKIDEAYSDGHAMGIDEGERIGYARGEAIGVAKGVKQGIEQGIEQGIVRGHKENQLSIAKILKKRNFSNKDIVDITNLTEEQVLNL